VFASCSAVNTAPPKINYIPCSVLPGPFLYEEEVDEHFPVRMSETMLAWADEYNAVWEVLCDIEATR